MYKLQNSMALIKSFEILSSFVDSSSECSPKFKKSQVATPSSSRGVLDSSNVHEESHYSTTSNAAIKPISLASRFDCFSDSD